MFKNYFPSKIKKNLCFAGFITTLVCTQNASAVSLIGDSPLFSYWQYESLSEINNKHLPKFIRYDFSYEKGNRIYPPQFAGKADLIDEVKQRIENGQFDVNARCAENFVLLEALLAPKFNVPLSYIQYLVEEKNADCTVTTSSGGSLLLILPTVEIAEYLVAQGASCSLKNDSGNTPLHLAAYYGRTDLMEFFLQQDKNFDVSLCNNNGDSVLSVALLGASLMGCPEEQQKLIEKLCQAKGIQAALKLVNLKSVKGEKQTPLQYARAKRDAQEARAAKYAQEAAQAAQEVAQEAARAAQAEEAAEAEGWHNIVKMLSKARIGLESKAHISLD